LRQWVEARVTFALALDGLRCKQVRMVFDPEAVRAFERARWQQAARAYESSFATATTPFIDPLLDAAGVAAGTSVLDIACGPGVVAVQALARGALARGLDFSPAMLAIAIDRGIAVDEGDAEALPYVDASFEAVVSNFGVHHVPRPAVALAEAHRVLRPGGHVAFSFWAEHAENVAWKLVFDAVARHADPAASDAPPPGGGFRGATQCAEALRAAGFVDCTTRLVHATWRHADARELLGALQMGTARMAAMIDAQPGVAIPAIIADIEAHAARYRTADGIAVPIAAVIAAGTKG
jgi:SAM-dependent methyltransferase